jgi:RNase P subunit RPR2
LVDINDVRSEFCQNCCNLFVPGLTCSVKIEDSKNVDPTQTCVSFVNLSNLASTTKYECKSCGNQIVFPGEQKKPIQQQKKETKKPPSLPPQKPVVDQTKELKQAVLGTSSKKKQKKKEETKSTSVSDFLNKLGI